KPKIYLPYGISAQVTACVLAHEQAHIRRKDHIWKPLGFLVLTLHWFNPLMWLGYILFCRDIELACDQKVVAALDRTARADYSQALLTCSVNKHRIAACPLAFSEVSVKSRVTSVLQYKKPALGVILAAVAVSLALAIGFLTSPLRPESIGIQSLSAKRLLSDKIELSIRYAFPTGGYSVRALSENEGEYCGDGMKNYDGALGKYRIMIKFGDTDPSEAFTRNFPIGEVVEIKNAPITIRAKRVSPEDHGFVLYLGFDTPIQIDETDYTMLNALGGTIIIQLEEE
ncbi:MAG: M56 family metallopeptidase, partial [Clostridia bacterium]|nr:M56 family metallopeptidase [Clostridia bacterium]